MNSSEADVRRRLGGMVVFGILVVVTVGVWAWSRGEGAEGRNSQGDVTTKPQVAEAGGGAIRVMTANVRIAQPEDGVNAWPNRREFLVKTLLKYGADVIGCQEVTPAQGAYLVKELGKWYDHYPRAGVGKVEDEGTAGRLIGVMGQALASMNTVFVKSDRFEIVDGEAGLVLPEQVQAVAAENTFYTLLVIREREPEASNRKPGDVKRETLIVVDTHLRHGEVFAARCAGKLREYIAAMQKKYPEGKVIVMGDMNHQLGTKSYATLVGTADGTDGGVLTDSFDYSKRGTRESWGNWHGFTGKSAALMPTDLILTGAGLKARGAEILRDRDEKGNYPSDHFFVMTDLK